MTHPELLGTVRIHLQGPLYRVRRYYRGIHPNLGTVHLGYTGLETVEETIVIVPLYTAIVELQCDSKYTTDSKTPKI